jgi:hypothetical protein
MNVPLLRSVCLSPRFGGANAPRRPAARTRSLFAVLPLALLCALAPALTSNLRAAQATAASPAAASPFTFNGWQFHEHDFAKVEEAIGRAPGYGVNFFIFSHELFRSVEGFLASTDDADPAHPPAWTKELFTPEYFRIVPGWQTKLRHAGDLALSKGIPFYLWVHEFDDVPHRFLKHGRVDMDDPALWPYLEQRYEKLLAAMPATAGFVLTLHESDFRVFRDDRVISREPIDERIRKVSQLLYDVLKRHQKQLILRNFFYEPVEMEAFRAALARLPDDIIVMSKDTTHEFHPFYPWDPQHGQTGKKRQIIEADLGTEKAWSTRGIYAQTDYIRRDAARARDTHLAGLVGRARLVGPKPFEDLHEVNLYAFSRFLQNPDLTVDTVLADWAARRYPAAAVPFLVAAAKRSEFIQHHGRWHLGYWFTKDIGQQWNDYSYYYSRVVVRGRYKWTRDPADQALEQKLLHPDADTFAKLVAEKDEVIAQARAGLADVQQAAPFLPPAQLAPWTEGYAFLLDAALLQREWNRAYFGMRMAMDQPSAPTRALVADALKKLQEQERAPGVTYGLSSTTGRRYNIDAFVLEMTWRMANRQRALAEDERILELARTDPDIFLRPVSRGGKPPRTQMNEAP